MRRTFAFGAYSWTWSSNLMIPFPITSADAPKTVLQSLVPSISVITSTWACVSRSVGRSAVPFLPSRSGSSKTVVLPHSPSSITRYSSLFSFSWRRLVQRTPHGSLSLLSPSYPHVLESPKHNICFILPYPYLFSMLLLKWIITCYLELVKYAKEIACYRHSL